MPDDTPRRDLRRLAAVLLALALVGVVVIGAVSGSRGIAERLRYDVRDALDAAGLVDVSATLRGREAELRGGTTRELARAVGVVEEVPGVRWARIAESDADLPVGAYVMVSTDDGALRVTGSVASPSAAAAVKATLSEAFGLPVLGDVRVDRGLDAPKWAAALPPALIDLVGVRSPQVTVAEGRLVLGGVVVSQAHRRKIVARLASTLPDLTIDDQLDVSGGRLPTDVIAALDTATVTFDRDSEVLRYEDVDQLAAIARVLVEHPKVRITAAALAAPGTAGQRRAQARLRVVRDTLAAYGVEAERVATKPVSPRVGAGKDPEAERHRRVDLVVKER